MNKSILMGRLVRDPEIRYTETENGELAVASFRLAVDRKFVRKDGIKSDFFSCSAFGRLAEFAEKYLLQGIKIVVTGHFENDNYQNRDGEKVYSVRLMAEDIEFAESKKASEGYADGEESSSRSSNRNAGRQDAENSGRQGASSRRGENNGSRGGGSRRSMQEDDYQDDYREEDEDDRRDGRGSGRRSSGGRSAGNRSSADRSNGSRSSGSRASGSRGTGSNGSANSGSGRRNSVDDDYMTMPEGDVDFD